MGGVESSHLDLAEYNINKTSDIGTFLFVGPYYNKTLQEFLATKKNISNSIAISGTNPDGYKDLIPDRFIYTEYTSQLIYDIIKLQLKKRDKIDPIRIIIEHDPILIPVDKLYRNDKNFQQLVDYTDRLLVSLVIVAKNPIKINLRKRSRKHQPYIDYIFISGKEGLDEKSDIKYMKKIYKYYLCHYMDNDDTTFRDTFNYYLTSSSLDSVLVFHKEQELFHYTPQLHTYENITEYVNTIEKYDNEKDIETNNDDKI